MVCDVVYCAAVFVLFPIAVPMVVCSPEERPGDDSAWSKGSGSVGKKDIDWPLKEFLEGEKSEETGGTGSGLVPYSILGI